MNEEQQEQYDKEYAKYLKLKGYANQRYLSAEASGSVTDLADAIYDVALFQGWLAGMRTVKTILEES